MYIEVRLVSLTPTSMATSASKKTCDWNGKHGCSFVRVWESNACLPQRCRSRLFLLEWSYVRHHAWQNMTMGKLEAVKTTNWILILTWLPGSRESTNVIQRTMSRGRLKRLYRVVLARGSGKSSPNMRASASVATKLVCGIHCDTCTGSS